VRGTVELLADPAYELERAVSMKYTGGWTDEAAGTQRFAETVVVERTTSQRGHGAT
jgi:hypothetical protein